MAEMDSTPSSATISKSVVLVLRILTFVFLLIALIIIVLDKDTEDTTIGPLEAKFNDIHAYRYMLSTIVIGFVYNLLQLGLSILTVISGKRVISGDVGYLFDFFGDKVHHNINYNSCFSGVALKGKEGELQILDSQMILDKVLGLPEYFGHIQGAGFGEAEWQQQAPSNVPSSMNESCTHAPHNIPILEIT
ncbi:PREDICTED: CASP-like protein 4D1 [Lupinus angustifolius]|uniref:CASP-like protein 4D1 n=1 Tax=Lupinus angustifolius TaxID=3871 RepID=UPI00092F3723|nr:PREDICTED: CASP-like protein 4D1 [Lupinus angustifolius]